jgi:glycine/D-amino acid oxidase-like deaminating enzyme
MTKKYDCIVIGGGHNGLVNAAYLARARASARIDAGTCSAVQRDRKFSGSNSQFVPTPFPLRPRCCELDPRTASVTADDLPADAAEIHLGGKATAKTRRIARHSGLNAEAYNEYASR